MKENIEGVLVGNRRFLTGNRRFSTFYLPEVRLKSGRFVILDLSNIIRSFGFSFLPKDVKFKSYKEFAEFFMLKNVCIVESGEVIYGSKKEVPLNLLGDTSFFRSFLGNFLGNVISEREKWNILFALSLMFSYVEIRIGKVWTFRTPKKNIDILVPKSDRGYEEYYSRFMISELV